MCGDPWLFRLLHPDLFYTTECAHLNRFSTRSKVYMQNYPYCFLKLALWRYCTHSDFSVFSAPPKSFHLSCISMSNFFGSKLSFINLAPAANYDGLISDQDILPSFYPYFELLPWLQIFSFAISHVFECTYALISW